MGIRLALYKGKGNFYDRLIRWWTGSPYSHCEMVMPDGRFLTSSPRDGGVRAKVIEQDALTWDFIELPAWVDAERIELLFAENKGLKYDWLGIVFCQIIKGRWHSRNRWFCSEFCAAAIGCARPYEYSPGDLADLLKGFTAQSTR